MIIIGGLLAAWIMEFAISQLRAEGRLRQVTDAPSPHPPQKIRQLTNNSCLRNRTVQARTGALFCSIRPKLDRTAEFASIAELMHQGFAESRLPFRTGINFLQIPSENSGLMNRPANAAMRWESGADAIGERIAPPIRSYSVQIPAVPVTGWRDYLRSALVGLAQLGAIAAAVHFAGVRATIAGFAISGGLACCVGQLRAQQHH